jgi:hypothetical protein
MMRRISAGLVAGIMLSALATSPAMAQGLGYHQGFWFGAGVGNALSDVSCDICVEDSKSVISGYLRAGITLKPNLLVGLEGIVTDNSEDGINERILALNAVGFFYPTGSGLFLKGGLGVVKYRADDDTDALTSTLLAVQLGTGYELRVSQRVSVVGFGNLIVSANGDLDFNGTKVTDDLNLTLIQFGLGVTMH